MCWRLPLLAAFLSGCVAQPTLYVVSQPAGAYVTEASAGGNANIAPIQLYYDPVLLERTMDAQGCYRVKGFRAQWVSGAVAVIDPVKLCPRQGVYEEWTLTMRRPNDHPDLERDLQFAVELQSIRAQEQHARAAQTSADALLLQIFNSSLESNQGVYCRSTSSGDAVTTLCR